MYAAIHAFLNFLKIERNASELTIKSYGDDLSHTIEFLQEQTGAVPEPRHIEVGILRAYVTYLHECGYARTTVAFDHAGADYDGPFATIVGRGNVLGVQFHPEKSQGVGLRMVANFVRSLGERQRRTA